MVAVVSAAILTVDLHGLAFLGKSPDPVATAIALGSRSARDVVKITRILLSFKEK